MQVRPHRDPNRRFHLQSTSANAQNALTNAKKKPDSKPKSLSTFSRNTAPANKIERSYTQEKN